MDSILLQTNLKTICRTCMVEPGEGAPMFSNVIFENGKPTDLCLSITTCSPIKLEHQNGLSNTICDECRDTVSLFRSFKTQYEKGNNLLELLLKKGQNDLLLSQANLELEFQDESEHFVKLETIDESDVEVYIISDVRDETSSVKIEEPPLQHDVDMIETIVMCNKSAKPIKKKLNKEPRNKAKTSLKANKLSHKEKGDVNSFIKEKVKSNNTVNGTEIYLNLNYNKDRPIEGEGIKLECCTLCKGTFLSSLHLGLHFINHALLVESIRNPLDPLKLIFCNVCGEVFEEESQLVAHCKEHGFSVGSFQCQMCQIAFTSNVAALKHKINCTNVNTERTIESDDGNNNDVKAVGYQCPICRSRFESCQELESHSLNHVLSKSTCRNLGCSKKFATELACSVHSAKTHSVCRYQCKECPKSFKFPSRLKWHVASMHVQANSCVCPTCGKCCKTSQNLYLHMRMHDEKKHLCSRCGYTTNKIGDLRMHMRVHTGERPYKCDYAECGKSFKTASNRIEHMRIHMSIKRFECPVCCRQFSRASTLNFHKLTHTGEKPHHCELCGTRFSRKHHLVNHYKTHK